MLDGGGGRDHRVPEELDCDREMRRVFPDHGPKRSEALRSIRLQNQARFDASMRMRQRPTRVS
jgi:hypothetical protein